MEIFLITLGLIVSAVLAYLVIIGYRQFRLQALGALEYYRSFSTDGIFTGEILELTETVRNPSWFPLVNVRIDFFAPAGLTVDELKCVEYTKVTSVFNLPPYSTVTKKHTVRADKRGKYELHNAGFSYRKTDFLFKIPIEFFAYPDCFDAKDDFSPDIYHAGNAVSGRKYIEDPFFVTGVHEYRIGDPMRSINFKASSRSFSGGTRRLMSNDYDSSRSFDTMIFLDLNAYSETFQSGEEQLETGLRFACFLFCKAIENGGRVGFCANCTVGRSKYIHIPCGSGEMHTKRILEQFAELDNSAKRDYSMSAILERFAPELPTETDIYLITPFIDEKVASMLFRLERAGHNVQVIKITGGLKN